jgi:hypothetical protein
MPEGYPGRPSGPVVALPTGTCHAAGRRTSIRDREESIDQGTTVIDRPLDIRKIAVAIFAAAVLFFLVVEIAVGGFDDAASIVREVILVALAAFLVVRTWRPISRR